MQNSLPKEHDSRKVDFDLIETTSSMLDNSLPTSSYPDHSSWSWPYEESSFEYLASNPQKVEEMRKHSAGKRRSQSKAAGKKEQKRKAAAKLQRSFIRRYGKL